MSVEASERVDASEYSPLAIPTTSPSRNGLVDESEGVDLSPELRADLLDLDAWGEILATYGRTMKVAVAFQGKLSQSFKTYFLLEFPLFLPIPHIIGDLRLDLLDCPRQPRHIFFGCEILALLRRIR